MVISQSAFVISLITKIFFTILGSPCVQFKCGNTVTIKPEKWIVKTPTGQFISRQQVPLKLAWAFSIHKSQVII